jgi:hypothetical protein
MSWLEYMYPLSVKVNSTFFGVQVTEPVITNARINCTLLVYFQCTMPPRTRLICLAPSIHPLLLRPSVRHTNRNNFWRTLSTASAPSISEWIKTKSSSAPTTHYDTLDQLRASHLLRTLPTRQDLPLPRLSAREGDVLLKGGHMIYFQPESALRDLGDDGSSPVRPSYFSSTSSSSSSDRETRTQNVDS